MPIVSVILPCYNAEQYLHQCLDSLLRQTLQEIEILCIDAGSTDGSLSVLEDYARRDPRVTVLSGFGRLDAGSARNLGLDQASGTYLSFLDADDFFQPEMLEEASRKAMADDADIVVFSAQQLDMKTGAVTPMPWSLKIRSCPRQMPFAPAQMNKKIFNSFENWTWNKLFRTDFIRSRGIRFQSVARTNDMAFTCEALALAQRITCLPKTFVTYRTGTGTSLQQTNDHSPTCFWEAYKELRNRLLRAGVYDTYCQSFLNTTLSGSVFNLNSVKNEASREEIIRILRSEAPEFGFTEHGKRYYYSRSDYKAFLALLTGITPRTTPLSRISDAFHGLLECCADHGLRYTLGLALRKLRN